MGTKNPGHQTGPGMEGKEVDAAVAGAAFCGRLNPVSRLQAATFINGDLDGR